MYLSMIDNNSYIHVWWWMVNDLELKWNDLYVYAIIYSFTNWTDSHSFNGSLSYLAEWTNSTIRWVQKNLKNLVDKWYIEKEEIMINNVKLVRYRTKFHTIEQSSENHGTKFQGGMEQSSNNIQVYNTNIIQDKESEWKNEVDIALEDLIEARKKLRKPMTERAIKLVKNKLERMYPWDTEMQVISINQSIERWWQSVFEVKSEDMKYYRKVPKKKKTIELHFT